MHELSRKPGKLAIGLTVLAALFALGWMMPLLRGHDGTSERGEAPAAARTTLPGLPQASAEASLASLERVVPSKGTVIQAEGPFDDRFTLRGLAFDGSKVTGTAAITSDVSDVLEFEALAGFYDVRGRLIGTARFTYHQEESAGHSDASVGDSPNELERFSIKVPANLRGTAVSAAVGVPVLVNE